MDESKKFAAFSIPRRVAQPETGAMKPTPKAPVQLVMSFDTDFAEIEYEVGVRSASSPLAPAAPVVPVALAQPIGPRVVDPIREKFYSMRELASGIPFARNDSGLFYKQAKFMEDFTDDYGVSAQFSMYYPYYQHMGYDELRTYFTWRTKARHGQILPTSRSYIFLYIYELLSGIGVKDPTEGLDKLMALWNAFGEQEPALCRFLPGWLKDYHIYYELPHRFMDFIKKHGLRRYYLDLFLFDADAENAFELWNGISSYDATESKFYRAGNDALMEDCFSSVLRGIQELCSQHYHPMEDLLTDGVRRETPWYPFQQALFYPAHRQPDREVELTGRESYACKSNHWTVTKSELDWGRRDVVGYIMKKTEACLRQSAKFRFKIKVNPYSFHPLLLKLTELRIPLKELDSAIERAVEDFHKNLNRTIVRVDHENLNRIREEALGTQDKLTVPEEDAQSMPLAMPPLRSMEPPPAVDGWAALKDALDPVERRALSMVLAGAMDMKAYAAQCGVMLEVLADRINEKAADYIGDSILELDDGMNLYEDYREKVAEMVG